MPEADIAIVRIAPETSFKNKAYEALKEAILKMDIYATPEQVMLDERALSAISLVTDISKAPISLAGRLTDVTVTDLGLKIHEVRPVINRPLAFAGEPDNKVHIDQENLAKLSTADQDRVLCIADKKKKEQEK